MHRLPAACRAALATLALAFTASCADEPTAFQLASSPALAKATAARYQLRFVATTSGGEITSDWFPAGGVQLNTNDPWRQMSAAGAVIKLTSPTHGVEWDGVHPAYVGTCRFPSDVNVNWSIETEPTRSFEGDWLLTVATSRDRYGINFYLEGPRVVDGVPSDSNGVIQNIASNRNQPVEASAPDASWFTIEFTNARLGFGSRSSPDGQGTLYDLPGYESACANFKIEAVKLP